MLPDTLIPYYAVTIDAFIFIIQQILLNNHSADKALQSIDRVFPEEVMLSEKILSRCYILFKQARLKLLLFFRKNRSNPWIPPDSEFYTEIQLLHFILEFSVQYISNLKSNACKLSHFYYFEEGAYIKNAHFLFGSAAQFRK